MPLGCGLSVCKWILGFFNFLIFICGGAVLGVGIWLAVDKNSMATILKASEALSDDPNVQNFNTPSVLQQAAYILIAAGAVIFLLGFLGCCGACQESKCMLATYAVFLSIFLTVEIAAGIYAAVAKSKFEKNLNETLYRTLRRYKNEDKDALSTSWDYVFAEMDCCGVEGIQRWQEEIPGARFPTACCVLDNKPKFIPKNSECPRNPSSEDLMHANRGCVKSIEEWGKKHLTIIIAVAVGVGLVQLLAVIFACCLCCALNGK